MFALPELQSLANALPLEFMSAERIGPDLRLLARVQGRGNF
jgi:diaminohydroxyphosphoribosylaminopyrimidine deaminase/5-amino-6-(5-phosphoribosylamino)uracil reductase